MNTSVLCGPSVPINLDLQLLEEFEYRVRTEEVKATRNGLICNDTFYAYRFVNDLANQLAGIINQQLFSSKPPNRIEEPGESELPEAFPLVAILMKPSLRRVVTQMALVKLGVGFVPLSTSYPAARIATMLRETKVRAIVCDELPAFAFSPALDLSELKVRLVKHESLLDTATLKQRLSRYEETKRVEFKDVDALQRVATYANGNPVVCVMYTSGSTGEPTGVVLRKNNLLNRLSWQLNLLPFEANDVAIAKTNCIFIDSLTEVFSALLSLTTLLIPNESDCKVPDRLVHLIAKYKVTRLVVVPALLTAMLNVALLNTGGDDWMRQALNNSLNTVIVSGELLTADLMGQFASKLQNVKLVNLYGSTETTGDITCQIYANAASIKAALKKSKRSQKDGRETDDRSELSIGTPLQNCAVYVLDENTMQPVEIGQPGLIYVSGLNIVPAYLSVSAKSKAAFSQNPMPPPFASQYGRYFEKMYRTGDIGMISTKSQLIYLGRSDSLVKISGQRFNMQEIKVAAASMPQSSRTKVESVYLKDTNFIAVFYVMQGSSDPAESEQFKSDLLERCTQTLPSFVHSRLRFAALDKFPLLESSGKLDRVALQKIAEQEKTW